MTTNTAPKAQGFDPKALAAKLGAGAATGSTNESTTPKATLYLGVGILRDGVDINADDFDPAKHIINLPQMQGLDNMKPDDRRASTQAFANEQAERNELLADLIEQSLGTLEPGESRVIPFYVTVYKKKDEVVAEPAPARERKSFF